MKQVTSDLTDLVKGGIDLKNVMGDHPWVTLGSAAAAGFVVASALTPARDETLIERIKSLVPEKSAAATATAAPAQAQDAPTATAAAKVPGAAASGGGVMIHIMDALKTALVSTLTSAISAKVATQPDPPQPAQGNGHAAASAGA